MAAPLLQKERVLELLREAQVEHEVYEHAAVATADAQVRWGKARARDPPSPSLSSSLCQPSTRQPPPFPLSIPRVHRPPTGPGARARRGRHGHEEPVPEGESSISAATPALRRRLAPALTPLAPKKTTPFPQDKKRRHILVTTLADAKVELKGPSWVLVT